MKKSEFASIETEDKIHQNKTDKDFICDKVLSNFFSGILNRNDFVTLISTEQRKDDYQAETSSSRKN